MRTKPLREVIPVPLDRGVRSYQHGYPSEVTIWHNHPEYELHAIRRTSGLCYVGTYSGPFEPGNLVMAGPNLPHMWVTDRSGYDEGTEFGHFIADRDVVVQFSEGFARGCVDLFSDASELSDLMALSSAGIQFSNATSAVVVPLMDELANTKGPHRLGLFFDIIGHLAEDKDRKILSVEWRATHCQHPRRLDNILRKITENLTRPDFTCSELAKREKMELSNFSRFFERHMNCSCTEYINRLRVYKACQLLIETDMRITAIAYDVGYGTLSTFNRNFQRFISLSPTAFRAQWRDGDFAGTASKTV